jgi:hypothetical protein
MFASVNAGNVGKPMTILPGGMRDLAKRQSWNENGEISNYPMYPARLLAHSLTSS